MKNTKILLLALAAIACVSNVHAMEKEDLGTQLIQAARDGDAQQLQSLLAHQSPGSASPGIVEKLYALRINAATYFYLLPSDVMKLIATHHYSYSITDEQAKIVVKKYPRAKQGILDELKKRSLIS